jgi:peptidylprolyl isomerase
MDGAGAESKFAADRERLNDLIGVARAGSRAACAGFFPQKSPQKPWPHPVLGLDKCAGHRLENAAMRTFRCAGVLTFALAIVSTGAVLIDAPATAVAQTAEKTMTTASGLQITDTKIGEGPSPKPGQVCIMHYTGWLYQNGQKGDKFDSSVDRDEPFEFPIGKRRVIAGWDEGIATMKVGGKRTLIIPPELGYGMRGAGGVIPPNATLIFDVELLGLRG